MKDSPSCKATYLNVGIPRKHENVDFKGTIGYKKASTKKKEAC